MEKFSDELVDNICERLATSSDGLVKVCKEFGIGKSIFYKWLAEKENVLDKYARAREAQADFLADEIIEIADTPQLGTKTVEKPTGIEVTEGDMTDHRRLRIDARKWAASKLYPKKYGENSRIEMDVTQKNLPKWLNESES